MKQHIKNYSFYAYCGKFELEDNFNFVENPIDATCKSCRKNFLNENLTRESIDWLEDYIGFLFQSKCESAIRCAELTAKLKHEN